MANYDNLIKSFNPNSLGTVGAQQIKKAPAKSPNFGTQAEGWIKNNLPMIGSVAIPTIATLLAPETGGLSLLADAGGMTAGTEMGLSGLGAAMGEAGKEKLNGQQLNAGNITGQAALGSVSALGGRFLSPFVEGAGNILGNKIIGGTFGKGAGDFATNLLSKAGLASNPNAPEDVLSLLGLKPANQGEGGALNGVKNFLENTGNKLLAKTLPDSAAQSLGGAPETALERLGNFSRIKQGLDIKGTNTTQDLAKQYGKAENYLYDKLDNAITTKATGSIPINTINKETGTAIGLKPELDTILKSTPQSAQKTIREEFDAAVPGIRTAARGGKTIVNYDQTMTNKDGLDVLHKLSASADRLYQSAHDPITGKITNSTDAIAADALTTLKNSLRQKLNNNLGASVLTGLFSNPMDQAAMKSQFGNRFAQVMAEAEKGNTQYTPFELLNNIGSHLIQGKTIGRVGSSDILKGGSQNALVNAMRNPMIRYPAMMALGGYSMGNLKKNPAIAYPLLAAAGMLGFAPQIAGAGSDVIDSLLSKDINPVITGTIEGMKNHWGVDQAVETGGTGGTGGTAQQQSSGGNPFASLQPLQVQQSGSTTQSPQWQQYKTQLDNWYSQSAATDMAQTGGANISKIKAVYDAYNNDIPKAPNVSATAVKTQQQYDQAITSVNSLQHAFSQIGNISPIMAYADNMTGWNQAINNYNNMVNTQILPVMKSLSGTSSTAAAVVQNYTKLLPSDTDNQQTVQQKWQLLSQVMQQVRSEILQAQPSLQYTNQ